MNNTQYHQRVLRMKAQLYSEEDSESLVSGTSGKRCSLESLSGQAKRHRSGSTNSKSILFDLFSYCFQALSSNVRMKNNLGALGYGTPLAIPAKCVEVTFTRYNAQVHEEEAEVTQVSIDEDGRIEVDPLILSISDRGKSKNVFKASLHT